MVGEKYLDLDWPDRQLCFLVSRPHPVSSQSCGPRFSENHACGLSNGAALVTISNVSVRQRT